MANEALSAFERIVRELGRNHQVAPAASIEISEGDDHPFDARNIHPEIANKCVKLFDDGHFQEAVFKALKAIEIRVKMLSGLKGVGYALMMAAFEESKPKIKLNGLVSESDVDEQRGFRFMFAGALTAIRNPRGHDEVGDSIDDCLEHLSLASYLMRRLDQVQP